MWKSATETAAQLRELPDLERLQECYALSTFWRGGIPAFDYEVDASWGSLIELRPEGNAIAEELKEFEKEFGASTFRLVLFGFFYLSDILIDWQRSNVAAISALLTKEMRRERIRFPHRFGRMLYDRFNDVYLGARTDHLLADNARALVEGTPQGVYQFGRVLIGPWGVLPSEEGRYKPFANDIPLWHCSDTGCEAIHRVKLDSPSVPLELARRQIERRLLDRFGRRSEWDHPLSYLHRLIGENRAPRDYVDLLELIADCVIGQERQALVAAALEGPDRERLRQTIALARGDRDAEGPPEKVSARLSPEEQLQMLLTLPDRRLVELIDHSIAVRAIRVPLGERRSSRQSFKQSSMDATSEISALGIRSRKNHEFSYLMTCIWEAYERAGLRGELEWRIRVSSGSSISDALMDYLRREGPAQAVRHLVLGTNAVTREVCERVTMPLKLVAAADVKAINRMLWKLGFNPEQYDDFLQRLTSRIRDLRDTVLSLACVESEEDRAAIRAAGVNLFVSVEELIEKLICFNVWVLAADHFLDTRFAFELEKARRVVPRVLAGLVDQERHPWDTSGRHTLGTLLQYLSAAGKWMQSLPDADRDRVRRKIEDLPYFATDPNRTFPFRHTELWADSDIIELQKYRDGFLAIEKLLQQADLAGIRNGLDHQREESAFPSSENMLACLTRLQEAVDRANAARYLPKVFWLNGRVSNRYGLVEYEYRDEMSRAFTMYGPPAVSGLPRHRYELPVVIAPGNLLGFPNAHLIFRLREVSDFAVYWEGYPRRRRIAPEPQSATAVPDDAKQSDTSEGPA